MIMMIKLLIMGNFSRIIICLCVCLLCVTVTYSELHRAKSNPTKLSVKSPKNPDSSYVAESVEENSGSWELRMFGNTYDTWIYAVLASILVGLSGIFPLLVIPIEAGPSLKHGAAAARLKLLLSFAVGGLLGDVFLHLLPEAWEHLHTGVREDSMDAAHRYLGLWIIAGMLSFLIIEKIFAKEDEFEHLQDECSEADEEKEEIEKENSGKISCQSLHECQAKTDIDKATSVYKHDKSAISKTSKDKHQLNGVQRSVNNNLNNRTKTDSADINAKPDVNEKTVSKGRARKLSATVEETKDSGIKVSGYLNLAANVIDNFTHGLAVTGGFLVNNKVGCITTLAILLHEIPHEVGDFAILLRSGFDRWKAAKAQLLTATGGMVGAVTALTADSAQAAGEKTLWILPFTSGGFIYIALVTVVPDLMEEKHPRESTKQILCLLAGVAVMYLVSMVH